MALAPVFCVHCGAANEAVSKSCFACGQALGETGNAASGQAELVKQRYRIVRQVGTGGFGAVYLAEDTLAKNHPVALKRINLAGLKPQEVIEATDAFNREVSLLPGLRHPHLPRVFDHFTDPDHWYLVMQYIEGETLEDYVQKRPAGRLSVEAVIDIGIQLAEVLHYLHNRQPPVIFRDLKPANIMRTPRGELFLIDFGIARIFKPGQARDTIAFGSPGYAPPEQYGKAQTTPQADLYSLGATLHALLTGDDPANTPFAFAPLSLSAQPAIAHLERLIMQMVQLDAGKRPASARAAKQELQDVVTELLQERLQALYPVNMPKAGFVPPYVPPSTAGAGGSGQIGQIQIGLPSQSQTAFARHGQSRRRFIRISAGVILTTVVAGGLMQFLGNFEEQSISPGDPGPPLNLPLGSGPLGTRYYVIGDTSFVHSVAWSPNGAHIASGGYDQMVQVFNAANGNPVHIYKEVLNDPVLEVAWSPDSQYIASVAGTVQVWHALSGKNITEYTAHLIPVNAVAWSPDGRYLASAAENVQVWEAKTGKRISIYEGHAGGVNTLAWSPDGKYIVSGGTDNAVRFWKPFQTKTTLVTYRQHTDQINSVSWSPDGKYIASAGDLKDMTVRIWYAQTGKTVQTYSNSRVILAVAWSPIGWRIASAGNDNMVQIWDAFTGDTIFTYSQHSNAVASIAWSPNGKYIISGSSDETIQVWQAE